MYSPLNVSYIRHPNVAASQLELATNLQKQWRSSPCQENTIRAYLQVTVLKKSKTLFLEQQEGKPGAQHIMNVCITSNVRGHFIENTPGL